MYVESTRFALNRPGHGLQRSDKRTNGFDTRNLTQDPTTVPGYTGSLASPGSLECENKRLIG